METKLNKVKSTSGGYKFKSTVPIQVTIPKTTLELNYERHKEKICGLLEYAPQTKAICNTICDIIDIDVQDVHNYTFESCSLVLGLKDMETCIEVCHSPQWLTVWKDKENGLFQNYNKR